MTNNCADLRQRELQDDPFGTLVAQTATRSPRSTPEAIKPRATNRASASSSRNLQRRLRLE